MDHPGLYNNSPHLLLSVCLFRLSPQARPKPFSYNQLFEGLEDDISPSPEAFLPRNSLKKLVLQSNKYSEPETPDLDYHHTTSSAEPEQSTAADMTTNIPPPPAGN